MKKLLTLLGSVGMVAATAATVVACTKGTQLHDILSLKSELQNILDTKPYETWTQPELQGEIFNTYPDYGIVVTNAAKKTQNKKINHWRFTVDESKAINYQYHGSIELEHHWIQNEIQSIFDIQSDLQIILNTQKIDTWDKEKLEKAVREKYEGIKVEPLISPRAWGSGFKKWVFMGDGVHYTNKIILTHNFTQDISIDISNIKSALEVVLAQRKFASWTKEELEKEIATKYEEGAIRVETITSNNRSWNDEPQSQSFKFIGMGNIENNFKYNGFVDIEHKWTKKTDTTEAINENETVKTQLQAILDARPDTAWDAKGLMEEIINKHIEVDGGIIVEKQPSTRASDIKVHNDKYKFIGKGNINNKYMYTGETVLTHTWNEKIDSSIDVEEIEDELYNVVNDDAHANIGWTQEELQAKIDSFGNEYEGMTVMPSEKSGIHHANAWLFTGHGTIHNNYPYKGTIQITHEWMELNQSKYLDKDGKEQESVLGIIPEGTKVVTKIGWDINGQAHQMPSTIEKVPDKIDPQITSLENLFYRARKFNDPNVSNWDTSAVTNMSYTFYNALNFNQPLNWNTANVKDMSWMFHTSQEFNQDLSNWKTESVEDMNMMFSYASKFDGNISNWKTSNVTDMSNMFEEATSFKQDLNWDTSNVTTMYSMFKGASSFNGDISQWNTSQVTDMWAMFKGATSFNRNLKTNGEIWDTSQVTYMYEMFSGATQFNGDISNWNTWNVEGMTEMFKDAVSFNKNINANKDKDYWDTSNVTNMSGMFKGATKFDQDIKDWNTEEVKNMNRMFEGAIRFNKTLTGWNTGNVTTMANMFKGATSFDSFIQKWDTSKVEDMSGMFSGATAFNKALLFDTSSVTNMSYMFEGTNKFDQELESNQSHWNTSKVKDMSHMFENALVFKYGISSWNTSNVTNMNSMFKNAREFIGDISKWNTSAITDMGSMFYDAWKFNQDLKTNGNNWNTSLVTDMSYMFGNAYEFNQDISSWSTSKVTTMEMMFNGALNFNKNISGWSVDLVENWKKFSEGSALTPEHIPPKFKN